MSLNPQYSIDLINDFINSKYLNGDVNQLQYFPFSNLENDKYFGCPNRSFDEDDTNLARAVMYIVWFNKLPELTYDEIGSGKRYRGDTINTFNSLFGKEDQHKQYVDDENINKTIDDFKKKYVTIGNFMLLPNYDVYNKKGIKSINCYRGVGSGWYDYFDKFLFELDKCLSGNTTDSDEKLRILIKENSFYFDEISSIQKFCEINYLESYLLNKKAHSIFSPYIYHWRYKQLTTEIKMNYKEFANKYIRQANDIIQKRSHIMMDVIRENL